MPNNLTNELANFLDLEADLDLSDEIQSKAEELLSLVRRDPDCITPYTVTMAAETFVAVCDVSDGLDEWSAMVHGLRELDHTAFAQILMEKLSVQTELTKADKMLALNVATHMGPDWAQKLYRFSVLVTKLA